MSQITLIKCPSKKDSKKMWDTGEGKFVQKRLVLIKLSIWTFMNSKQHKYRFLKLCKLKVKKLFYLKVQWQSMHVLMYQMSQRIRDRDYSGTQNYLIIIKNSNTVICNNKFTK